MGEAEEEEDVEEEEVEETDGDEGRGGGAQGGGVQMPLQMKSSREGERGMRETSARTSAADGARGGEIRSGL